MNFFMVYIGGDAGDSNIEVHDIRFVAGERIEDTYPQLFADWYGIPKSLHLDSYVKVKAVGGYRLTLADTPQKASQKLFFVNLGGYHAKRLNELHDFGLFVAKDEAGARAQAMATLLQGALQKHKDDVYLVDSCTQISTLGAHHVHLEHTGETQELTPDWYGYHPIGKGLKGPPNA